MAKTAQPIAWHEECLKNLQTNTERQIAKAKGEQETADRMVKECLFRERQIAEAKRLGKPQFDGDRFLKWLKPASH